MRRCAPVPPIREQFSVSQPLAVLVSSSLVNSKVPVACVTTKLLGTILYSAATSKHSWTTACGMLKQERASRVVATFLGVAFGRMGSTEIDVITPDMAGLVFGKTVALVIKKQGYSTQVHELFQASHHTAASSKDWESAMHVWATSWHLFATVFPDVELLYKSALVPHQLPIHLLVGWTRVYDLLSASWPLCLIGSTLLCQAVRGVSWPGQGDGQG
jgi:hypothetical protein